MEEDGNNGCRNIQDVDTTPGLDETDELQRYRDKLICLIPHVDLVKEAYHHWTQLATQHQKETRHRFLSEIMQTPQSAQASVRPLRMVYYLMRAFDHWSIMQEVEGACGVDEELAKLNHYQETDLYKTVKLLQAGVSGIVTPMKQVRHLPVATPPTPPSPGSYYCSPQYGFNTAKIALENGRIAESSLSTNTLTVNTMNRKRSGRPFNYPNVPRPVPSGDGDNNLNSLRAAFVRAGTSAIEMFTHRIPKRLHSRSISSSSSSSSSSTRCVKDEVSPVESGGEDQTSSTAVDLE